MRGFQERLGELTDLGARVAGVSADTWAVQGAFCTQNAFEFPVLSDWPANETIKAFGVDQETGPTAKRATFVFDADGVCRAVIEDADMEAHSVRAVEAVRELVRGAAAASS